MSLRKFSWRSMWRRPGRTILTLLSIVIGVAAVVSVTITTTTTRHAYKRMFSTLTGKAALVVEGVGETSFSEDLLPLVEGVPGVRAAVPVVRKLNKLFANDEMIRLQILGVDLERDSAVRDYAITSGRRLEGGKEVLLEESFANRVKVKVGDEVKLLSRRAKPTPFKVVGLLQMRGGNVLQHTSLVLLPLQTAQTYFAGPGRIDSIQVVVDEKLEAEAVQAQLEKALPTGVVVRPSAMNTQSMQETLYSSQKGLQMTTACTLLLAAFIILNTFMMNVSERRRQLSILRAIGAKGGQVTQSVLGEATALGLLGTGIGIAVGLLMAYLLNRSLSDLLEVPLPGMQLTLLPFALAIIFGLGVSVIGAFVPARNAGRVSPLEGMDRVSKEDLTGIPQVYIEFGAIMTGISGILVTLAIRGFLPVDVAIYAGVFLLIGVVLLSPLVLEPLCQLAVFCMGPLSRVESGLALRQVLRHHARSTLTVGVLFVAGAGGVGMAYSILDNVRDVQMWYRKAVVGDFFIRSNLPDSQGRSAKLPDELGEMLAKVPGIATLDGMSSVQAQVADLSVLAVGREFRTEPAFDLVQGNANPAALREELFAGKVVVGSVLAQRLGLGVGDDLELDAVNGKVKLSICGVTNDYLAGGLTMYMSRDVAVKLLSVEGYDFYSIRAQRGQLNAVRERLQKISQDYGVVLHSFADIANVVEGMIRGISGCLWGLVVLVFVVASFGVVNTLTMNVLEQTRELGLLRIVAMTKGQVRRTILTQALIMGVVGFTPGVFAGVAFAWVINLAMPGALGHPVEFGYHPWLVGGALGAAMAVTTIAAWFPAQRAAQLDVVSALHYE